ncbi:uncharacterized protein N7511_008316 [Penicillium nucicola]|uniref:uncharacterized protein n=1 Tax=Penicillium nucicola TaxID=1850975 RepID=UPI002545A6A7|nr:uncharacterized protein N7511_008316 [Penicillium nucicola]KAJ5754163.1 hypothetical protein N7511_008316 [Penicillium nucicola]
MKTIVLQVLPLCTAALSVLGKSFPEQQELLVDKDVMVQQTKVYGHNDAVYDVMPKEDQLYSIEFLEIAPTPIDTNRVLFALLSGYLPDPKKNELALPDEGLVNATLKFSGSVVYADGTHDDETSGTFPLKTTPFNNLAYLSIRNARGDQVDYLPSSSSSTIVLDFQFIPMFLRSGTWTIKVDARLGDEDDTCLFAMSMTQWLDGRLTD